MSKKSNIIAPSILSINPFKTEAFIEDLCHQGLSLVHLDIMDGNFVPPITFGAHYVSHLPKKEGLLYEAHLMVDNPEKHFDSFIDAGCRRIIFHIEATNHAHRLIQILNDRGIQAGVAINPSTPIESILSILEDVDMVTVMTVNPGWGGQKLIQSTLRKVQILRKIAPDLDIQVDGGIDEYTAPFAATAGANILVAGSYLAKDDVWTENYETLERAVGLE